MTCHDISSFLRAKKENIEEPNHVFLQKQGEVAK
jgi:hypothetical protein